MSDIEHLISDSLNVSGFICECSMSCNVTHPYDKEYQALLLTNVPHYQNGYIIVKEHESNLPGCVKAAETDHLILMILKEDT